MDLCLVIIHLEYRIIDRRISDLGSSINDLDARLSGTSNLVYIALGLAVVGIAAGVASLLRRS